jgi:hypothetical protein
LEKGTPDDIFCFMALNETLLTVVLESLAFFDLAPSDDLVESDVAEEQSDGALNELRRLSPDERKEFAEFARKYADKEEKDGGTEERIEFFRALASKISAAKPN